MAEDAAALATLRAAVAGYKEAHGSPALDEALREMRAEFCSSSDEAADPNEDGEDPNDDEDHVEEDVEEDEEDTREDAAGGDEEAPADIRAALARDEENENARRDEGGDPNDGDGDEEEDSRVGEEDSLASYDVFEVEVEDDAMIFNSSDELVWSRLRDFPSPETIYFHRMSPSWQARAMRLLNDTMTTHKVKSLTIYAAGPTPDSVALYCQQNPFLETLTLWGGGPEILHKMIRGFSLNENGIQKTLQIQFLLQDDEDMDALGELIGEFRSLAVFQCRGVAVGVQQRSFMEGVLENKNIKEVDCRLDYPDDRNGSPFHLLSRLTDSQSTIQKLSVSGIYPPGVEAIATALYSNVCLNELHLGAARKFLPRGALQLARLVRNARSLTKLSLEDAVFQVDGFPQLCVDLQASNIRCLRFEGHNTRIPNGFLTQLCCGNRTLKELEIRSGFEDVPGEEFRCAIVDGSLTRLALGSGHYTPRASQISGIISGVKQGESLSELTLIGHGGELVYLGSETFEELIAILRHRPSYLTSLEMPIAAPLVSILAHLWEKNDCSLKHCALFASFYWRVGDRLDHVFRSLYNNECLESMDLCDLLKVHVPLSRLVFSHLPSLKYLRKLSLPPQDVEMCDDEEDRIVAALASNSSLEDLIWKLYQKCSAADVIRYTRIHKFAKSYGGRNRMGRLARSLPNSSALWPLALQKIVTREPSGLFLGLKQHVNSLSWLHPQSHQSGRRKLEE
jgi:hypothetical protein